MTHLLRPFVSFLLPATLIILQACSSGSQSPLTVSERFSLRGFNPMVNWHTDSSGQVNPGYKGNKLLYLDYVTPRQTGFLIPSHAQTEDGLFHFEFAIRNTGTAPQQFAYKIFYQNESYKFPEQDPLDSARMNPYAAENFYGSWEEVTKTFVHTGEIPADDQFHPINGSFRIVGNPRGEERYFNGTYNERWKRNPRVGEYSFLLVVTSVTNLDSLLIPAYIQNIGLLNDSNFVNPYYYFLYGKGASLPDVVVARYPWHLKVIAKPDPGAGIYANPSFYPPDRFTADFTPNCGNNPALTSRAAFEQFVHYIDSGTRYDNIPVIADVLNEGYTLREYNWNKQFIRKEELISVTATTARHPCQTVLSDAEEHKIILKNPGTEFGRWEKQNVGVITRHGFTYGKWTVKARLTELINEDGLWNGLTNAIWLITQDLAPWNYRRDCRTSGYFANYYGGETDQRVQNVGYSEIDFEILKTVKYCPNYILPPAYNQGMPDPGNISHWDVPLPSEVEEMKDRILVACTNWDMACEDPENYRGGCNPIIYEDQVFWQHKWGKTYRAITSKTPEPDDELFASPYYYFQIDWQPERIIWRIGPEKDRLRAVGYVDHTITSIPNNQMLLIISQEFHNTRWWIGSMFEQANIPFPKNDIIGEIYEVTIE